MDHKVLVIQTSVPGKHSIRFILSKEGMTVDFADTCSEAEERLRVHSYSLVIIDEAVDGFFSDRLLDFISSKERKNRLPVLLLTGEENADNLFYTDGKIECRRIAKPFSSAALQSAVRRATGLGSVNPNSRPV
ncbi:MAG: hypothetical protein ACLFQW_09675 [Spirochaetaceae bacterium]